jgi:hypothetical protein
MFIYISDNFWNESFFRKFILTEAATVVIYLR